MKKILNQATITFVQQVKLNLENNGITTITCLDDHFPLLLLEIPDPPLLLFVMGNTELLSCPLLAMVGTRIPTSYGRQSSYQLAYDLTKSGFVIVSGMARGIDTQAHYGALLAGRGTIAVLGSGVDIIYPNENRSLYMKIKQEGLLLSEYPPGTEPRRGLFPERNRIISGLCHGVIVVEAAIRSGSNITVDCALDQGREVFAVPGPIFSPQSEGPHNWIKQGARLITGIDDIVGEYPWSPIGHNQPENFDCCKENEVNLRQLLDIIENKQLTVDELCLELAIPLQAMIQRLLSLELKGEIRRLPGNRYERVLEQKSLTNGPSIINNRED